MSTPFGRLSETGSQLRGQRDSRETLWTRSSSEWHGADEVVGAAIERFDRDIVLVEPIQMLTTMLIPREQVELIEKAHLDAGSRGVFALTDRRVIYLRRVVHDIQAFFWQYDDIVEAKLERGFLGFVEVWLEVTGRRRLKFGFGRANEAGRTVFDRIQSRLVNQGRDR